MNAWRELKADFRAVWRNYSRDFSGSGTDWAQWLVSVAMAMLVIAAVFFICIAGGCGSVDVNQGKPPAKPPEVLPPPVIVVPIPGPPLPVISVELLWAPVIEDTDGKPIELEGYRLQWGQNPSELNYSLSLKPDTLIYVIDDLPPGEWFFQLEAFDYDGSEGWISAPSNVVSQVIS